MASIPAYAAPAFLEFVAAHAAKGDPDAQRLIARVKPGKRIPKSRAPGSTKEERRAERNERMASIREAVMTRAAGKCEWCGAENMALEAHHVISGGARRAEERPETVAAVCWDCHRKWHRNDEWTMGYARAWANRNDFGAAYAAIERRIMKMEAP